MGIEKFRRKVIAPKADIKNTIIVRKIALKNVDSGGGVLSLANPLNVDIIVDKLVVDITTVATATCALSAGVAAANGTTLNANLIDTLDVHTATVVADNNTNKGSGGLPTRKWLAANYFTISVASGASAGLVGNAYITFHIA